MPEDKRLFAPGSVSELINGWLIHAHKARDRHDLAARTYARGQYALGIPALIASTIVGTSVFSSLSNNETPALWVGLLSITAAALGAVQTFLDFGGRTDKHRLAAVKYKSVIRCLESMSVRLAEGHAPGKDDIEKIETMLDTLEEAAPVVMPKIYDTIEGRYENVSYVAQAVELYRK
jgi:hypothetical protein